MKKMRDGIMLPSRIFAISELLYIKIYNVLIVAKVIFLKVCEAFSFIIRNFAANIK